MKELWTRQAVLSHLTLNGALTLNLARWFWSTVLQIMEMHMHTKIQVNPTLDDVMLRKTHRPLTMADHIIHPVFDQRIKSGFAYQCLNKKYWLCKYIYEF